MYCYLINFTFEINLFSLVAFLSGIIASLILFGLVYFIGSISSLKKKDVIVETSLMSEQDIKNIINKHLEVYQDERKRRKEIPFEVYRDEIYKMMEDIASKFYPKSKRPLMELSIDEVILLNRYILSKLEELLSHGPLRLLRKVRISQIVTIVEKGTKVVNSEPVQAIKKSKLKVVGEVVINVLGVLNPVNWVKKLIIDPTTKAVLNAAFDVCFKYIGEETYKIYSKQALSEMDKEISNYLKIIDKDYK